MAKKLYFMYGLDPVKVREAESKGYLVRDVSMYRDGDSIEQCDEAAGEVPEPYKQFVRQDEAVSDTSKDAEGNSTPNTVKELNEALLKMGVEIPPAAKKAELLALYQQHTQSQNAGDGEQNDQGAE